MYYFVINSKNYTEASGPGTLRLASSIQKISLDKRIRDARVKFFLAVPAFAISDLSKKFPQISLFAQHLDNVKAGSTTGYLVPEIARSFGAAGSILNHSEHRIPEDQIQRTVNVLRSLGMKSIVCARDENEVGKYATFEPDFIAIEPPELIGSGTAVSKARPDLISNSKKALEEWRSNREDAKTILLCGAGIVDAADVRKAVELGAQGILVASGVIKAKNWRTAINGLARGFTS